MHKRFSEQRERIGFRSANAFAEASGIPQSTVSRIESGKVAPNAEALAALAKHGGDVHYVLTGEDRHEIDYTLLGIVEAAIVDVYCKVRPHAPRPRAIRTRQVVMTYAQVVRTIQPQTDVRIAALCEAERMIARLDDPLDPEMLDRNLLPPTQPQTGGDAKSA